MKRDSVNIYWAPYSTPEVPSIGEWNMLYPEPHTLLSELAKKRNKSDEKSTYFSCPVTFRTFQNTYVFTNELPSSYEFDFTDNNEYFVPLNPTSLNTRVVRNPSITTGPIFSFSLRYCFFTDEPLELRYTPPYFHPPGYTKYGTTIPGHIDIGQWFRPVSFEIQMWDNKGELHIGQEPIFYIEFKTDKKINLQRFTMNQKLVSYTQSCIDTSAFWPRSPLKERYSRFNRTRMPELILKEIRNNLI